MKKILISIIVLSIFNGCAEIERQQRERQEYLQELRDKEVARANIDSQYNVIKKDVLYHIEKNPSKYHGSLVAFYGRVIQATETNEETILQLLTKNKGWYSKGFYDSKLGIHLGAGYIEPSATSFGPSLIVTFRKTNIPVAKTSYIKVLGYIGPTIEGYNVFGASVSSLTMAAIAIAIPGDTYFMEEDTVYYQEEDEELIKQWKSGELISSK